MTFTKSVMIGSTAITGMVALGVGGLVMGISRAVRRNRMTRLRDKVVVITGASRGLGLALAEEFGRRGAKLVLAARDSEELNRARLLLLSREATEADRVITIPVDLRRAEEAESLIRRATEHFRKIDILVNNAGTITAGPVEHLTIHNFHDVMDTNFFAGVHCSLAALPQMLGQQSGSIVNIASIGGKVAVPHLLSYSASKFAVVGLSQGLHAELRSKGVHVLTVCPGLMRTGSHVNAFFCGDAAREYRWFSLLASLPGMSAKAQRAARAIVSAVVDKKTEIAITPQAALATRFSQTAPSLTTHLMSAVNQLLPKPVLESADVRRGSEVRERELMPASKLGWSAAQRYNQVG
jgi:short-subunit dehydrogenase